MKWIAENTLIKAEDGKIIAMLWDNYEWTTDKINQHRALIAAAPELLEALKSCLFLIDQLGITEWTDFNKCRAAIKKATI